MTTVFADPHPVRTARRGHTLRPLATPSWRPRHGHPGERPGRHLRPVPGPQATSHEATRQPRTPAVVRRRRLVLAVGALGILIALALPWGGARSHPLTAAGPVLAGAALAPHTVYVVQPGDTMWGIAERLSPGGDPRAIVAALSAQVGSDTLQPGEHLLLP